MPAVNSLKGMVNKACLNLVPREGTSFKTAVRRYGNRCVRVTTAASFQLSETGKRLIVRCGSILRPYPQSLKGHQLTNVTSTDQVGTN
jgi:hypothetical protein